MNGVVVRLSPTHRNGLLASVPQYSEIWNAVRYAQCPGGMPPNDVEYILHCDPAGAEILLHAARAHCPDAVKNIELAIQNSRAQDR